MPTTLTQFSAADDLLHNDYSAAGPLARESLALTAPLPEHGLLLFAYVWREGGTKWGRFVFVAGADMAKPEYLSFEADAEYAGDDLRDFTVSGLRVRQPEPLRVAEFACADGELDLALRFEGIHAPFSWHDNADGCPEWVAHNRYEQSGLTSGRLMLRGRELEFTGVGHRDHSWGTRDWWPLQHWKWINAATPDGRTSLHCTLANVKGDVRINGYTNRDGVVTPIVTATAKADLDEAMVHRRVQTRVVDETGVEMTLDAHYSAGWTMPIQHMFLNEIGMSATLDGRPATAHVELGWPQDYVQGLIERAR
jgi:hypothetical protein